MNSKYSLQTEFFSQVFFPSKTTEFAPRIMEKIFVSRQIVIIDRERRYQRDNDQIDPNISIIFKGDISMNTENENQNADQIETLNLCRKAAENGDIDAQRELGFRYGTGDGVEEDQTEAVKWIRTVAEQGDSCLFHIPRAIL